MAIRLIREDEHLTCEISGVTFHYRRPTPDVVQSIRDRNTTRGKTDDEAFANEMLRHCVFNWDGDISTNDDGEPTPYDPALLTFLPMKIKVALVETVADQVDGKHVRANPI